LAKLLRIALLCCVVACSSPRSAFDQKMQASDFAFVMAWGSGWHGFAIVRVSGSGDATYLYGEEDNRWLIPFSVSPEELRALRSELDRLGYWTLPARISSGAADGTQWFVKVRDGSRRHAVYLDNSFPPPIEDLSEYVKRTIVSRALARKSEAEPADYDEWREREPRGAEDTP
jgi:hypothetical protein